MRSRALTQRIRSTALVILVAGTMAACEHATSPLVPGSVASAGTETADNKKGGNQCSFGFTVTFADGAGDKLRSDGLGAYVDTVDKIMAATGSGPGFRLDTNGGSQRLDGAGGVRTLHIDFDGVAAVPPAPFPSANRGVDLRFYLNDGGLDVCSLAAGASGTVGLTVAFSVLAGTEDPMTLTYGVPETQNGGPIIGERVVVTRNSASTWTVVGQTAGLRDGWQYSPVVASNLTMPFTMTLVRN